MVQWCQIPYNPKTDFCEFINKLTILLNDELNLSVEISIDDIDIAHPLPPNKEKEQPICIKFLQRSIRNEIFGKKSNFYGTGTSVSESLTKRRLSILKHAQKTFGFRSVWTNQGKIFCNVKEKKIQIKNLDDINRLKNES